MKKFFAVKGTRFTRSSNHDYAWAIVTKDAEGVVLGVHGFRANYSDAVGEAGRLTRGWRRGLEADRQTIVAHPVVEITAAEYKALKAPARA